MALNFLNDGYFAGNVGIGTNTPSTRLDVSASADTNIDIVNFNNFSDITKAKISLSGNSSGQISLIDGLSQNNIFITSSGRSYFNGGDVGIGTTSPNYQLDVIGDARISSDFRAESSNYFRRVVTTIPPPPPGLGNLGQYGDNSDFFDGVTAGLSASDDGLVYRFTSLNTWALASNAAEASTEGLLGINAAGVSSGPAGVITKGIVWVTDPGGSIGDVVYLGTSGGLTVTPPTASGSAVRVMGYKITTGKVWFEPAATIKPASSGYGLLSARYTTNIATSVDSTVDVSIPFNLSDFQDAPFTNTSNNVKSITQAGRYRINSMVSITGQQSNYRYSAQISIKINGTIQASQSGGYIRSSGGAFFTQVAIDSMFEISTEPTAVEILIKRINAVSGNATVISGQAWVELTKMT